jgi:hypothetical protein
VRIPLKMTGDFDRRRPAIPEEGDRRKCRVSVVRVFALVGHVQSIASSGT